MPWNGDPSHCQEQPQQALRRWGALDGASGMTFETAAYPDGARPLTALHEYQSSFAHAGIVLLGRRDAYLLEDRLPWRERSELGLSLDDVTPSQITLPGAIRRLLLPAASERPPGRANQGSLPQTGTQILQLYLSFSVGWDSVRSLVYVVGLSVPAHKVRPLLEGKPCRGVRRQPLDHYLVRGPRCVHLCIQGPS